MSNKKSTVIYRKLLREAWSLSWQRKKLWIFGIFASLLASGGIYDVLTRTISRVEKGGNALDYLFEGSVYGFAIMEQYLQHLLTLDSTRTVITLTIITLICVGIIVASIISQSALFLGLHAKEYKCTKKTRKEALKHFTDVFILNAINKALTFALTAVTSLTLGLFLLETTQINAALFFGVFLLFIPLTITINVVTLMATVDTVLKKRHAFASLHEGWIIFKRHWLAALELGLLLFFFVLLGGLVTLLLCLLLAVPAWMLLMGFLLAGQPFLYAIALIFAALLFLGILLAYAGLAATFQYAAWLKFYKRASHTIHGKKFIAKLLRLSVTK
jgi:hypothetical protein